MSEEGKKQRKKEFSHLRAPANAATDGEHHGKERERDAHSPEADSGVEIDVRVEVTADEVSIFFVF